MPDFIYANKGTAEIIKFPLISVGTSIPLTIGSNVYPLSSESLTFPEPENIWFSLICKNGHEFADEGFKCINSPCPICGLYVKEFSLEKVSFRTL